MKLVYGLITSYLFFAFSCKKSEVAPIQKPDNSQLTLRVYAGWPEGFEAGTKTSYAAANVTLSTGSWNLSDALIGTSTSDQKFDLKSIRIQNSGVVSMNFDLNDGSKLVSVYHAKYGTDAASTWELWYSTNSGTTWQNGGATITTSNTSLQLATFSFNISQKVRFQIRKTSGGRLNIDQISIEDNLNELPSRDDHLVLGNPSNAVTLIGNPDNYLLAKTQYALSYNNSRGTANWVSWHLSSAWKGTAARCDCFTADNTLPSTFFKATTSNFTNTGFDRGHMCPSEDRDGSSNDNAATFLMTNIIPQAPNNNQITWAAFENYCRTLMNAGNELYIISGGYGIGGNGRLGGTTNTIASGKITVPSRVWKVAVILPVGSNDASRVTTSTRIIAIDTPNTQTVNNQTWGQYRTSVDAIEAATGLDLLSALPTSLQSVLEAAVDNGPTQ